LTFDFLGTYNQAQLTRFQTFATAQLAQAAARSQHLAAEILRIGTLTFAYDSTGTPIGYVTDPESYVGKLVAAYEILGGDVAYDLMVRSRAQALFLIAGSEASSPQMMSNGEIVGARGLADAETAVLTQQMKAWMEPVLDYRREYLERKIMRMLDYVDQLTQEVSLLAVLQGDTTVTGSLAQLLASAQAFIDNGTYRAVTADTDPYNRKGYAPYASYDPGGPNGSTADSTQRTFEGIVDAGATDVSGGSGTPPTSGS
jgi:hypothetical protein